MTIIWAKKIKWKWTLFADDCISNWTWEKASASMNYRKKIRDLPRAKNYTLCATAWTCREVDLIMNYLDKDLSTKEYSTSLELLDIIQETIVNWCKTLKEVDEENPTFNIFLLDVNLNVCYLIEEFSVKILSDNVECVCWCWQEMFYKIHKEKSKLADDDKFIADIVFAAKYDDWCACPIFVTNWENFYTLDSDWEILSQKHMNLE